MPLTYTRRFRVRSTDCDATGQVNHAVYARYMQETAIEASADAGYTIAWYEAHGVHWLIRRSRIDYLRPARYGDELVVTTYVVNFRRVRSQRNYDIDRSDGLPIARAATDWVFVDTKTATPRRIPDEVGGRFLPDGPPPGALAIDPAPPPDEPPAHAFHTTRRVNYYDMDENRHVNNAVYLNYLEQATLDADAASGFDLSRWLELGGLFVVRQHDIEYVRPAKYGDRLTIVVWTGELAPSSVLRHTTMRMPGDDLSVRAQTRWEWMDRATGIPAQLPDQLRAALARQPATLAERGVTE